MEDKAIAVTAWSIAASAAAVLAIGLAVGAEFVRTGVAVFSVLVGGVL